MKSGLGYLVLSATLILSCAYHEGSLEQTAPDASGSVPQRAYRILSARCASCHGPSGPGLGGFDVVLDLAKLVARRLVVPGDAGGSRLFQRVSEGSMPPSGPLPDEEKALLRRWIDEGAKAFDTADDASAATFTRISGERAIELVHDDLLGKVPADARSFVRYVSFTHLYNLGTSPPKMAASAKALDKVLNSLSWKPEVASAVPIDPDRTIYRIDLRSYLWTRDTWAAIDARYPYGLAAADDEHAAKLATIVSETVGPGDLERVQTAIVRGDWLVSELSQPPLYNDVLGLPTEIARLEATLGIDVAADIETDDVVRAGFRISGVSLNNRIIERHRTASGAYWRSYDFTSSRGEKNIFDHPIGPAPVEGSSVTPFRPDGGEIIFSLPNGLQGYALVNGTGARLDRAPTAIVRDPSRPDFAVTNGLSCMGCHVQGMNRHADEIRARFEGLDAFDPATRLKLFALYPGATRVSEGIDEDVRRFATALGKLGIDTAETEPVLDRVLGYEANVGLDAAAAELELTPEELRAKIFSVSALSPLAGELLLPGRTLPRAAFTARYPAIAAALGRANSPE